jgi:hypothetical protein
MGIENFFNSILSKNCSSERNVKYFDRRMDCKRLYLDFNSILFFVSNNLEEDINYIIYSKIINKIDEKCLKLIDRYSLQKIDFNYISDKIHNDIDNGLFFELIDNYIKDMKRLVNVENINTIFISIDSIPSLSKIIEQRRRRMISFVKSGLKRKLYEKYADSFDINRRTYEDNKFKFKKSFISPVSNFMDKLKKNLNTIKCRLSSEFINLENVIISDHNDFGEGEKKIMDDIINNDNKIKGEKIVIYSPDSDVIILSMINQMKLCKSSISVIRHNTNEKTYDNISIDDIMNSIFQYISKDINLELNIKRVINDICFIITLFGNDFIPKLEAIDLNIHLEVILDIYKKSLVSSYKSKQFGMYILYDNKNNIKINFASFGKFIEKLSLIEVSLLKDRYMYHNYLNYNKLRGLFNVKLLYPVLLKYMIFANLIFSKKSFDNVYDKTMNKICDEDNGIDLVKLIDYFIKIEKIRVNIDFYKNSEKRQLEIILNIVKKHNITSNLKLIEKKFDVESKYNNNKIKRNMFHPEMNVSLFDKELFCMNKGNSNYDNMFNKNDIGMIKMNNSAKYKYEISNIQEDTRKYYNRYFDDNTNTVIEEYMKGLLWVFDYYLNGTGNKSDWYYKYSNAPLIFNISKYMHIESKKANKWNIFDKMYINIRNSNNDLSKYEYYLYVNSVNKLSQEIIGNDIKKIMIDKGYKYFYNLELLVENIWNKIDHNFEIGNSYLSKGRLIKQKIYSITEFRQIIHELDINICSTRDSSNDTIIDTNNIFSDNDISDINDINDVEFSDDTFKINKNINIVSLSRYSNNN